MSMTLLPQLLEMALLGVERHGDDETHGFSDKDLKNLENDIEVIKRTLEAGPDFYLYIVKDEELSHISKDYPEGVIQRVDNGYKLSNNLSPNDQKLMIQLLKPALKLVEKNATRNPDAIHFIMGDNHARPQHPLTGWIIMHRLMHALEFNIEGRLYSFESFAVDTAKDIFKDLRSLYTHTKTSWPGWPAFIVSGLKMKSARMHNSGKAEIDDYEVGIEIATEIALTGDLRFEPPGVPKEQALEFKSRLIKYVTELLERSKGAILYI